MIVESVPSGMIDRFNVDKTVLANRNKKGELFVGLLSFSEDSKDYGEPIKAWTQLLLKRWQASNISRIKTQRQHCLC